MKLPLRLPSPWLASSRAAGKKPGQRGTGFVQSILSYTRLDVPSVERWESVVSFGPGHADPLAANESLSRALGGRAGEAFLFRADSETPGRYWVYSREPWREPPLEAISALAPKRHVLQLAEGLPYRFTLEACVGRETVIDGAKHVDPFRSVEEVEAWLPQAGAKYGFRPDFFHVAIREIAFPYQGRVLRIRYAALEGVMHITDEALIKPVLLRGVGSHRRVGLGLLQISG
ncbi:MAG: type I-E CRISPR-associated protein Cas6/Cse3/CasE [Burkholderiaceae bacterium]